MLQHPETTEPAPGALACVAETRIGPSAVFGQTRTEPLACLTSTSHRACGNSWSEVASDLGLYTQPDPVSRPRFMFSTGGVSQPFASKDASSLFAYASGNPVQYIDPLGLCCTGPQRAKEFLKALALAYSYTDRTFCTQLFNGTLYSTGGGCGYNADGLVQQLNGKLECWKPERVDAGPKWMAAGVFEYSRVIPHSFVRLTPVDPCDCNVPPLALDNYFGWPASAPFDGSGWSPL